MEQSQSVLIKNAFKPEGHITDWWKTNMNPQSEKWNAHINTESDILPLYYSDPANGMNWVFDTNRDYRDSSYLPPGYLEASTNGSSNNSIACNMGDYGVKTTYQMNVYNATDEPRTFVYRVDTVSNLFLAVRNANGSYKRFEVNGQSMNTICTGTVRGTSQLYPTDTGDVTVKLPIVNEWGDIGGKQTQVNHVTELEVRIPPKSFQTFYIDQVLATGDPGSIPTRVFYR